MQFLTKASIGITAIILISCTGNNHTSKISNNQYLLREKNNTPVVISVLTENIDPNFTYCYINNKKNWNGIVTDNGDIIGDYFTFKNGSDCKIEHLGIIKNYDNKITEFDLSSYNDICKADVENIYNSCNFPNLSIITNNIYSNRVNFNIKDKIILFRPWYERKDKKTEFYEYNYNKNILYRDFVISDLYEPNVTNGTVSKTSGDLMLQNFFINSRNNILTLDFNNINSSISSSEDLDITHINESGWYQKCVHYIHGSECDNWAFYNRFSKLSNKVIFGDDIHNIFSPTFSNPQGNKYIGWTNSDTRDELGIVEFVSKDNNQPILTKIEIPKSMRLNYTRGAMALYEDNSILYANGSIAYDPFDYYWYSPYSKHWYKLKDMYDKLGLHNWFYSYKLSHNNGFPYINNSTNYIWGEIPLAPDAKLSDENLELGKKIYFENGISKYMDDNLTPILN